jgi:hypothetical protein
MPFMQRITWSGIALRAGPLPRYPSSRGCVRMPYEFAQRLFDMTKIGMRVIMARNDVRRNDILAPLFDIVIQTDGDRLDLLLRTDHMFQRGANSAARRPWVARTIPIIERTCSLGELRFFTAHQSRQDRRVAYRTMPILFASRRTSPMAFLANS